MNKIYREKNGEAIKERQLKYYSTNREILLSKNKEWYKKNRDKLIIKSKKYRIENALLLLAKSKEQYKKHKQRYIERAKRWTDKNKDKRKVIILKNNTITRNELRDHYVKYLLTIHGISNDDLTKEMIDLKRMQLTIMRLKRRMIHGLKRNAPQESN